MGNNLLVIVVHQDVAQQVDISSLSRLLGVVIMRLPRNPADYFLPITFLDHIFSIGYDADVVLHNGNELRMRLHQADHILAIATPDINNRRSIGEIVKRVDQLNRHVQRPIIVAGHCSGEAAAAFGINGVIVFVKGQFGYLVARVSVYASLPLAFFSPFYLPSYFAFSFGP